MESTKTALRMKIYPIAGKTLYRLQGVQTTFEFVDDTDKEKAYYKRHTHNEDYYRSEPEYRKSYELTDTAIACIHAMSPMIVAKDLRQIFAKRGNDFIIKLYNQVCSMLTDSNIEFAEDRRITAERDGKNTDTYEVKLHDYKLVCDDNGKLHRMETIPYEEHKITDYYREEMAIEEERERKGTYRVDGNDLVNACELALFELAKMGIIQKPSDCWAYAGYAFNAVNKLIDRERKSVNDTESFETLVLFVADDGEEIVKTAKQAYTTLKGIETASVIDSVKTAIVNSLSKKIPNRERVASAFIENTVYGVAQSDIASEYGVTQQAVAKWIKYGMQVLASPEVRERVHRLIVG